MNVILDKVTMFKIDTKRFDVIKEVYYRNHKTHDTSNLLSKYVRYYGIIKIVHF